MYRDFLFSKLSKFTEKLSRIDDIDDIDDVEDMITKLDNNLSKNYNK